MKLKIYFEQLPWNNCVNVHIVGSDANGNYFRVKKTELVFEKIEQGFAPSEPTFHFNGDLSREFMPALSQALAESGYKPLDSDAGELKATKEHIAREAKTVDRLLDLLDKKIIPL